MNRTRTNLHSCAAIAACFAAAWLARGPAAGATPETGATTVPRAAVGTGFTYQGQLKQSGLPLTDTADFQFTLWDALNGGNQIGAMFPVNGKEVVNGLFSVDLDFGAGAFSGEARWLQIEVRAPAGGGDFNTLSPRQAISASPYALKVPGLDGWSLDAPDGDPVDAVHVDNDGNVGIGTPSPASKLDVAGTVAATAFVGDGSGLRGISRVGATVDLNHVALLRWDLLNQSFPVGTGPRCVAFDGANIWVSNYNSATVTKLRAFDGANLGTFSAGTNPVAVVFDGANIWVSNYNSTTVTKLRASDGAPLGTLTVGIGPYGMAFDGGNLWVANSSVASVTKLRVSDGANLGTFPVGSSPRSVVFDGANVWVANMNSATVTKLRASDGANLGTFDVGMGPYWLAFDGANVWVANSISGTVTKLRASDGAHLGSTTVSSPSGFGDGPNGLAFDGTSVWVTVHYGNSVTKLRCSDGANEGSLSTLGIGPHGVAFDGANVWVVNGSSNTVRRFSLSR